MGSQAILAKHPDAPPELLRSMEADTYPRRDPSKADIIDGALGDGSIFHQTFGYYAHGIAPETAIAPEGWEQRLLPVTVAPRLGSERSATALCLEPHDLVLSKCVAGRERDWAFARDALRAQLVDVETLLERVDQLPIDETRHARIGRSLKAIVAQDASDGDESRRGDSNP